jgi:hypothetical protein
VDASSLRLCRHGQGQLRGVQKCFASVQRARVGPIIHALLDTAGDLLCERKQGFTRHGLPSFRCNAPLTDCLMELAARSESHRERADPAGGLARLLTSLVTVAHQQQPFSPGQGWASTLQQAIDRCRSGQPYSKLRQTQSQDGPACPCGRAILPKEAHDAGARRPWVHMAWNGYRQSAPWPDACRRAHRRHACRGSVRELAAVKHRGRANDGRDAETARQRIVQRANCPRTVPQRSLQPRALGRPHATARSIVQSGQVQAPCACSPVAQATTKGERRALTPRGAAVVDD